ncbi:Fic family protein [Bacillus horti]|uniref:Fic family protein n=1 Tax=Caldalkalibacillus horti TaxID=77523 RepID=A0ABT9VU39_9BACI|nr:Fic family protein [Bacillus horti]MDQ0164503.1 Fic family protein [Bacillus horti]
MRKFPNEYLDDILVRLAHHSSAIEGNTISLPETVSIILHNTITGNRDYDLREVYEVSNHRQAFDFVLNEVSNGVPLSLYTVKEIHSHLTDKLQYDKGLFKSSDNAILGADFVTASAKDTPFLMQQWVDNLIYRLDSAKDDKEKIQAISETHIEFERIHPFSDGNGRTGRLLITYSLLQHDFPPIVIQSKERARYISFLAEYDVAGLSRYIESAIESEEERINRFQNASDQQIDL